MSNATVYNSATSSGIDRNYQDDIDQATTILSQFVAPDSLAPAFCVDPAEKIKAYATANNVPVNSALRKYRETLKALCCDDATRVDNGRVSLDTSGTWGGRLWSCPQGPDGPIPQIVFASLRTTSAMYVPGKVEAIACYYLPPARDIHRVSGNTGLPYSTADNYDATGYMGIVRTFGDLDAADEHRELLEWAVKTVGRPAPSDENPDGWFDVDPGDELHGAVKVPARSPEII